jgi:arabinan endo-1,5-alpha-L-arabinosidase
MAGCGQMAGGGAKATPGAEQRKTMIIETTGDNGAHDPTIVKEGSRYYLFTTGAGIPMACSDDLKAWKRCGRVFETNPEWITIPGVKDLWAPDIKFHDGRFYLYYSASTFGSNRSAIGLATNKTLDSASPDYQWVDEGMVVESVRSNDYNAIDPNLTFDPEGKPWLAFGSFWTGIKMVALDPATLKPAADAEILAIAQRPEPPDSIEGAYIMRRGEYHYLFISHDLCCRGVMSTYNIKVGRAEKITGPYVDRDGTALTEGGGWQVLDGKQRWKGPGHNSVLEDGEKIYLVYHSYDAQNAGKPTLRIEELIWDADGWPIAPSQVDE